MPGCPRMSRRVLQQPPTQPKLRKQQSKLSQKLQHSVSLHPRFRRATSSSKMCRRDPALQCQSACDACWIFWLPAPGSSSNQSPYSSSASPPLSPPSTSRNQIHHRRRGPQTLAALETPNCRQQPHQGWCTPPPLCTDCCCGLLLNSSGWISHCKHPCTACKVSRSPSAIPRRGTTTAVPRSAFALFLQTHTWCTALQTRHRSNPASRELRWGRKESTSRHFRPAS
mmetsp:Transcript_11258/g.26914  ORF Transcript_11258/g.26914 Transcript_11258/m.26914 type:complete len:226 (-) Transcript_11258:1040-1717(-)